MIPLALNLVVCLLAMSLAVSAVAGIQSIKLGPQQVCRVQHLELQNAANVAVTTLERLNPIVISLRSREVASTAALAAAVASGDAAGAAAATAELAQIRLEKREVFDAQKAALQTYSLKSQVMLASIQKEISSNLASLSKGWGFMARLTTPQIKNSIQELPLKKDASDPEPSIYERADNFSEAEVSSSRWTLNFEIDANWTRKLGLAFRWLHFEMACSASLFEEGGKWTAKLVRN